MIYTSLTRVLKIALVLMVSALIVPSVLAADKTNAGEKFFEERIRPLLADQCFSCHGSDKQKGGFRLDSKAAILKGGDIGTAVVPGDPAASLLIKAVAYNGELKMPPKGKLNPRQISDLSAWVKMGAPWPDTSKVQVVDSKNPTKLKGRDHLKGLDHWAFLPVKNPTPPLVKDKTWVKNPIDQFILAKLEAKGIKPAKTADKRILARRAYFDLLGIPPDPKELEAFLKDESPTAFAKLVDKLLESPLYGERWARHWLDVARYADSNGMDENLAYASAWRYRDWVIKAFNSNMPFDEFIRMQIAGDLFYPDNHDGIIATGFLTVGPKMLAEDDPVKMQMDIIDEQLDTLGQSFMGLTLGCARCHDHKFDPIPTKDYYSLAGIFKSTKTMDNFSVVAKWQERPLVGPIEIAKEKEHDGLVAKAKQEIKDLETKAADDVIANARMQSDAYLKTALEASKVKKSLSNSKITSEKLPEGTILVEAESFSRGNVKKDHDHYGKGIGVLVNLGPMPNFVEYDLIIPADGSFSFQIRYAAMDSRPVKVFIASKFIAETANQATGSWFPDGQQWQSAFITNLKKGKNLIRIERDGAFPHIDKFALVPVKAGERTPGPIAVSNTKNDLLPVFIDRLVAYLEKAGKFPEGEDLKKLVQAKDGPFALPNKLETILSPEFQKSLKPLRDKLAALEKSKPKLPSAMAVSEDKPSNLKIHIRGNHLTLGPEAPRGFPGLINLNNPPKIDEKTSGRKQFAQWITQPDHPLTSRVAVNRLWTWHFGDGIVRTPDNFGTLGDLPLHSELLDWLASSFLQQNWSVKAIHKVIMNSSTYQMSSEPNPQAELLDPDNRLHWHWQRLRLDAESFRDSLLTLSSSLDRTQGGSLLGVENRSYVTSTASKTYEGYNTSKRSIYLPVIRSAGYEPFQAFDFPDPSVTKGRRAVTNIPAQSLLLMNGKLVQDQTRKMAELFLKQFADDSSRLQSTYESLFSRSPLPEESSNARQFLQQYEAAALEENRPKDQAKILAWQGLFRALLSTNEFIFVE